MASRLLPASAPRSLPSRSHVHVSTCSVCDVSARGLALDWEVAGWTSVLGALLVVGLQIWQLTELPFFPGSSGYASCFIGWASLNIALLLSGIYWIETLLARHARLRRALREDGGTAQSTLPAARMFRASMEGCAYYWGFIGLVATLFWVLFYVL